MSGAANPDPSRRRRWAASHGAVRGLAARRAREGVLDARLAVEPGLHDDPWPVWERLRSSYPFAPGAVPGMLVTVHHDVARQVLASDAFAMPRAPAGPDGPPGPQDPPSLIALDGEGHARHRGRLTGSFTARAIARLAPRVEQLARELAVALPGAAGPDGVVDLVAAYAHPLPLRLITELLGLPADGTTLPPELPRWGDAVVAALDSGTPWEIFDAGEDDRLALQGWLGGQVAAARAGGGPGGLVHRLATGPDPVDDADLVVTVMFLLAAGFETTTHLLSTGAVTLAAHPAVAAALRAEPDGWPGAVDELLRWESPVTRAARCALRDVDVAGTTVRAGELVVVHTAAANHDPAVFADPATFDPARTNARAHLAFSHGPHHCLGAGLARLEGAIGLRVLLECYPGLRPAGPATLRPTTLVRGRASLPCLLH